MNEDKTRNMVVLKDLPSNIAKEAYIVLKPNIRIKNKEVKTTEEKWPVYIVKEAENVINNYLSSIEDNKKHLKNFDIERLKKKNKKLKKLCIGLGFCLIVNLLLQLVL